MKKLRNVSAGTWVRTALLAASLANTVMTAFGIRPPVLDSGAGEALSTVFTVGVALLVFWKNNSFTEAAQVADRLMKAMKEDFGHTD